jgi:hypothetical protein
VGTWRKVLERCTVMKLKPRQARYVDLLDPVTKLFFQFSTAK